MAATARSPHPELSAEQLAYVSHVHVKVVTTIELDMTRLGPTCPGPALDLYVLLACITTSGLEAEPTSATTSFARELSNFMNKPRRLFGRHVIVRVISFLQPLWCCTLSHELSIARHLKDSFDAAAAHPHV